MAEKAGLGPNVTNHSGRKTMIQALTNNDIPATDIIQLSGHKNLQSLTNYSVVPEKQQVKISHTLSEPSTGRLHVVEKSNLSQVSECFSTTVHSPGSAADYQQGQQAMSLFTGAVQFMVVNSTSLSAALINHRLWPLLKLRLTPQRGTKD